MRDMKRIKVKDWTAKERPREKISNLGGDALSDAELLAIIIGSGSRGRSSLDLSREVLKMANGSFIGIRELAINKLQEIHGIGFAKATMVKASLEIARRVLYSVPKREKIVSSQDAYHELRIDLADLDHEEFWVIYLDRQSKIILKKQISSGGLGSTVVDQRIIFKVALDYKASTMIVAHNHPSGSLNPSQADLDLTKKLVAAGKIMDVQVIDHLILAGKNYCSFADSGLL